MQLMKVDFSGLPGGVRTSNGNFEYITEMGRWWCFEDAYQDYAHTRPLHYDQESTMNHMYSTKMVDFPFDF